MKATLWLYDGQSRRQVAVVDVPADTSPPDVVYWGYRTFVLIASTGGEYREAVTATVPVLPPVEPFARG